MEIGRHQIAFSDQDQIDIRLPIAVVPTDCAEDLIDHVADELSATQSALERLKHTVKRPQKSIIIETERDRLAERFENLQIVLYGLGRYLHPEIADGSQAV